MSEFVGIGVAPGPGARRPARVIIGPSAPRESRGQSGRRGWQRPRQPAESCSDAGSVPGAVQLQPAAALELARRVARQALRSSGGLGHADAARDIAADALVVLLERSISFAPRSVVAAAKHLARKHALRPRLSALIDQERELADVDPSEEIPLRRDVEPRVRAFFDGSTAQLEGELCTADIPALKLRRSDGAVLCGHAALEGAQRLLLAERHRGAAPCQASNARRAVAALERDALLLSVAGLPWREALDRLAAQGVVVTRDGLRSGLRAARRRCMGLAAHGSKGSGRVASSEGDGCASASLP
ncbi:hypothetical protein [Nannocystis pusilla]|uniref:hypothetical protein n=1 Tax=Nannocystis pusilla TaxID=889268 RepID=UPI003BF41E78